MKRTGRLPRRTRLAPVNRKRKGHRFPKHVHEAYRSWIRGHLCLVDRPSCYGSVECAHVRSRGAGGVDLGNCVPLCAFHHAQQHYMGIKSFQKAYGLDLAAIASRLADDPASPGSLQGATE